jgi:hypothetical protein
MESTHSNTHTTLLPFSSVVGRRTIPVLADVIDAVEIPDARLTRSQLYHACLEDPSVLEQHLRWSRGLP